jgi:mono/diheme cytochrome c family protein
VILRSKSLSAICSAGLLTGCTGGFQAARSNRCSSGERRYGIRNLWISYKPYFACLAASLVLLALPCARAFGASNTKADELAGAVLFQEKGCAHCHGRGGSGGKKGPDLANLRKDKQWTPAKITNQILNGGQKMPAFSDSLTDPEIAQVVAYLRARRRPAPPPGDAPPPNQIDPAPPSGP